MKLMSFAACRARESISKAGLDKETTVCLLPGGFGFRVQGLGFRVQGYELRV